MPLRAIISLPRSYTRDGRMISPRAERLPFPFPLSSLCVDVHVSRSLHRGPRYNRACIWQYLTCFRKRSLVTEMRSRSDNSYVEYYTVEELPLVPYRASDARPPAHARCAPVSNFRIIRPLSAIRQFRQFRNGTWECGATVGGGGERKKRGRGFRLQTTLKFDRCGPVASGATEIFLSRPHTPGPQTSHSNVYTSKSYTCASCTYRWSVVRFPVVYRLNVVINCKATEKCPRFRPGEKFFKLSFFSRLLAWICFYGKKIDKYFFGGESFLDWKNNKDLTIWKKNEKNCFRIRREKKNSLYMWDKLDGKQRYMYIFCGILMRVYEI